MATLAWSDDLKLGHTVIDEDHEHFVSLANQLQEADGADFQDLFAQLLQHCEEHFGRENALMEEVGFPATPVHQGEHARVIADLKEMKTKVDAGNLAPAQDFCRTGLFDWFTNHKDTMDFVTTRFIVATKGAS